MVHFEECHGAFNCVERCWSEKKKQAYLGHDPSLFDVDNMGERNMRCFEAIEQPLFKIKSILTSSLHSWDKGECNLLEFVPRWLIIIYESSI